MEDRYDLGRFIEAQRGTYDIALAELRSGKKRSHWMWFIFPQIAGLGFSAMAQRYAISSTEEAQAFLEHPVLGERLKTCTAAVNNQRGRSAREIFGSPDDMKFRSCMTLFSVAAPDEVGFSNALEAYFGGQGDPLTLEKLTADAGGAR
jgi:uncharacterized protein (DUF1810 family)